MPANEASAAGDLALLCEAAVAGGAIALRYWRQSPQVWEKPGLGPVTEADLAVNLFLRQTLGAARRDYGWLSEEDPDGSARLRAERVFVIDPIDGTRAFIAGEKSFSLSLAVVEAGEPVAAAVYLPAHDRLYSASTDQEPLLNGAPIRASSQAGIEGASLLSTGQTLDPANWPGGVPDLRRGFRASLAYRMCLVAEGRFDAMMMLRPTWEWDIAAGALIAARAGAVVSDGTGARLRFNRGQPQSAGIIAAPAGLHAALMGRLAHGA